MNFGGRIAPAIALAFVLAVVPAPGSRAAAAAVDAPALKQRATDALWWGDFEALQRLHDEARQPGLATAAGNSPLLPFRAGVDVAMSGRRGAPDAYFVEVEALTLQWAREHPQSPLAQVLHAQALLEHAFAYRGNGYANTVPPQAWADFEKYLKLAADFLVRNAAVAFRDSSAHVTMIDIGRASGWAFDRQWAIAKEGLKIAPDDFGLYAAVLHGALPKWGGSAVQVDRFVEMALATAPPERRAQLYADLYALASRREFQHRLFADSGASWPRMRAGLRDRVARHPHPDNVNRFAYFACLAEDRPTAAEMLDQVGAKPVLAEWGSNAQRSFETCQRWARQS